MRKVVYNASGEIHKYLNEIKSICEFKQLKLWALDPFAKIKVNEELKSKLKESKNLFLVFFSVLRFNRKREN